MKAQILVPMYNESPGIQETLSSLLEFFDAQDIIVVDDGSTDGCGDIVKKNGITVITHPRTRGYGASIKTALRQSSAEYVCWYDADGQHAAQDARDMIAETDGLDAVIGIRSKKSYRPLLRRPGKALLHWVANALSPEKIPDVNCGLRVFKRSTIMRYIHLLPDGFSASTTTTLLAINRGFAYRFREVLVTRRKGKSTVRQVPAGFSTIHLLLRIIVLFNPLTFFFPISLVLFSGGAAYGITVAIINRQGLPAASLLLFMSSLFTFFFGLISDQISEMHKGKFEEPR